MAINIIHCNMEQTRDLVEAYNEAIRRVPHCYPVGVRQFAAALLPALGGDPVPWRSAEAILAAREQGVLVGFAHVAVGKPGMVPASGSASEPKAGLLRFFWYRPGCRQAGEVLLGAAEAYCRERGTQEVMAFLSRHTYPFYHLQSAHLSDRLGHVSALLGMRGYERVIGEVYMDWRDFTVTAPGPDALPISYVVEHVAGRSQKMGITVRALLNGEQIGICESRSAGERSNARSAQEWLFTEWLAVEDAYQGRGFGRSLLQRTLLEGRKLGYRHAVISTMWKNYRACNFYTNFGYRVSDWTYGLAHTLV